jgi:hypothetical protein
MFFSAFSHIRLGAQYEPIRREYFSQLLLSIGVVSLELSVGILKVISGKLAGLGPMARMFVALCQIDPTLDTGRQL